MAIEIPGEIAVDLRNPVAGDSFGWEAIEPAAAKKSIVIHGTASEASDEDGFVVADYHVNHNGWGGCGVHLVCTKDAYQGRQGYSPAGVQLHYVGDLSTWRAGTANQNPGRIHIEISGLFTGRTPSEAQLRKVRQFIDWAISPNEVLPSINFYSQVTYHNAVPDQSTACPGWQFPQFNEWFGYLQGGAEPSWWSHPTPEILVPPPIVPQVLPEAVSPEWVQTWTLETRSAVVQHDCAVVDVTTMTPVANLAKGTVIANIAGHFQANGLNYYRTQWSVDHGRWNGINVANFVAEVPVTVGDQEALPSDHVIDLSPPFVEASPNEVAVRDAFLELPPEDPGFWRRFWEPIAKFIAGLFNKTKDK